MRTTRKKSENMSRQMWYKNPRINVVLMSYSNKLFMWIFLISIFSEGKPLSCLLCCTSQIDIITLDADTLPGSGNYPVLRDAPDWTDCSRNRPCLPISGTFLKIIQKLPSQVRLFWLPSSRHGHLVGSHLKKGTLQDTRASARAKHIAAWRRG